MFRLRKSLKSHLGKILERLNGSNSKRDIEAVLLGTICSSVNATKQCKHGLKEVEFRVFSQFGDDGIIQWLTQRLPAIEKTFVEFGVENYTESNTRFLLMKDNWQGFVMDGSSENIGQIVESDYYWRHDLTAIDAFITVDNVNELLKRAPFFPRVGLLHIDIDGNDYWVWNAIGEISPALVIVEYNAVFDAIGPVSIPYTPSFRVSAAHYSGLYFGCSLSALVHLGNQKGYALIGCNSAGNNAYFLRRDLLCEEIPEQSYEAAFIDAAFRQSRDESRKLSFLRGKERLAVISGLELVNVVTNARVEIGKI